MIGVNTKKLRKPSPRRLITVRRRAGNRTQGIVAAGPLRLRCALGRSGTSIFKREGDGATPVAALPLIGAYLRTGRMARPATTLAIRHTRADRDGWCDASGHACYNRPVRLPFGASAEHMARADRLYDFVVILDWNFRSRRRGCGSAIFLHVARSGYAPTEGCVALAPRDIQRLAPFLMQKTVLQVLR